MAETKTPEYIETLRNTSGEQKLKTAFQMYWNARELKSVRLREQHPDWSEEQVKSKVREIFMYARS